MWRSRCWPRQRSGRDGVGGHRGADQGAQGLRAVSDRTAGRRLGRIPARLRARSSTRICPMTSTSSCSASTGVTPEAAESGSTDSASVLSCFDRVLFRGDLPIMSGGSMAQQLQAHEIDRTRVKPFLLSNAERVKAHCGGPGPRARAAVRVPELQAAQRGRRAQHRRARRHRGGLGVRVVGPRAVPHGCEYDGVAAQAEYFTDVLFETAQGPCELYPRLLRRGSGEVRSRWPVLRRRAARARGSAVGCPSDARSPWLRRRVHHDRRQARGLDRAASLGRLDRLGQRPLHAFLADALAPAHHARAIARHLVLEVPLAAGSTAGKECRPTLDPIFVVARSNELRTQQPSRPPRRHRGSIGRRSELRTELPIEHRPIEERSQLHQPVPRDDDVHQVLSTQVVNYGLNGRPGLHRFALTKSQGVDPITHHSCDQRDPVWLRDPCYEPTSALFRGATYSSKRSPKPRAIVGRYRFIGQSSC